MSSSDYQEILNLDDGVYQVKYHRLSIQALRNKRSRLMSQVMELRNKIGELYEEIDEKKTAMKEKQSMLNKLTDEKIKEYIKREEDLVQERIKKANEFLREYIGEENFKVLQEKGNFEFKGLDGNMYRIKKDGKLQRLFGQYWYSMCMIKPSKLPLPDIIASVFTAASKVENGLRDSQVITRDSPERRDAQR